MGRGLLPFRLIAHEWSGPHMLSMGLPTFIVAIFAGFILTVGVAHIMAVSRAVGVFV